jgi:hypothetical protein
MYTNINKFKKSLNESINENIEVLDLNRVFTPSDPKSYTVEDIVNALTNALEADGSEIDEQELLSKLTAEFCQEFVDNIVEILYESSDEDVFMSEQQIYTLQAAKELTSSVYQNLKNNQNNQI